MKFGENFQIEVVDWRGDRYKANRTYKRANWREYHTDDFGEGLWRGDKQIEGTCQFSVTGCTTEKVAKAKIRNYVKKWYEHVLELDEEF